jgi:hypothetical protein
VTLDAAQVGSFAHRLRNFWTNLAVPGQLAQVLAIVERPAGRLAKEVLGQGRVLQRAKHSDKPPQYVCNQAGQELAALPTLVAYPKSYAFKAWGPGAVWDQGQEAWSEPTPDEREVALGYKPGDTAAPGVSEAQRHAITGRCMDARALEALMAISVQLRSGAAELQASMAQATAAPTAGFAAMLVPASPFVLPSVGGESVGARAAAAPVDQMLRMGWRPGQGLGAQGQGMATPLVPVQLPGRQGVGYSPLSAADNNAAHLKAVQRRSRWAASAVTGISHASGVGQAAAAAPRASHVGPVS